MVSGVKSSIGGGGRGRDSRRLSFPAEKTLNLPALFLFFIGVRIVNTSSLRKDLLLMNKICICELAPCTEGLPAAQLLSICLCCSLWPYLYAVPSLQAQQHPYQPHWRRASTV